MSERREVLRLESGSAGKVLVPDGVAEAVLSIQPMSAPVHLVLARSFRTLQLTGHDVLPELIIESGAEVSVVAAVEKQIDLLRLQSGLVDLMRVLPSRVELSGEINAVSSLRIESGTRILELIAKGGVEVSASGTNSILLASGRGGSPAGSNSALQRFNVVIARLDASALSLHGNVTVEVQDWVSDPGEGALLSVVGEGAILRVTHRSPEEGLAVTCPEGEVHVAGASVRRLSGQVRRLSTSGPAVVHGVDGVRVKELRCDDGAKISGLAVGELDLASIDYVANATSFDVQVPKRFRLKQLQLDGAAPEWGRDPSAWRALYSELETKGQPRSARWARTMEREARRATSPRLSVERAVLEAARLLGYGESPLRPIGVQALVCAVLVLCFTVPSPLPSANVDQAGWPLFVQLFLSPLWLVNSDLFASAPNPPDVLTAARFVCAFSGTVCFATAGLAVRRLLAYGQTEG